MSLLVLLLSACASTPLSFSQKSELSKVETQMGMLNLKHHYLARARFHLEDAIRLTPHRAQAQMAMGYFWLKTHHLTLAKQYYQKAQKWAPNNPNIMEGVGVFECLTGHPQQAELMFLKATQVPGFLAVGLSEQNAGSCAYRFQHFKKAEQYFRQALQHDKMLPLAYLRLAQIEHRFKHDNLAWKNLQGFNSLADPTAASLTLGIDLAQARGNHSLASAWQMQLNGLQSKNTNQG